MIKVMANELSCTEALYSWYSYLKAKNISCFKDQDKIDHRGYLQISGLEFSHLYPLEEIRQR